MSDRDGLSLGYILRAIRAITNGAPLPEDFADRQERTRKDRYAMLVRFIFVKAPITIVVMTLWFVYVLPAIKRFVF
jgi:hypothetical protein